MVVRRSANRFKRLSIYSGVSWRRRRQEAFKVLTYFAAVMKPHYRFATDNGVFGSIDKPLKIHRLQNCERGGAGISSAVSKVFRTSEALMQAQENTFHTPDRDRKPIANSEARSLSPTPELRTPALHLFEHQARATLAERYPVLTCFVICCGMMASAVMVEIECLQRSGYFWRQ